MMRAAATAIQFLTRLPVPGGAVTPEAFLQEIGRALRLFPLVGAGIGALTALALWLVDLVLPFALAVLVALAIEARLTGALHEDALADLCDGAGGGRSPEDALRIMKDSRVGAFGVLGLGFGVALRAGGLMASGGAAQAAVVLIVAGCLGRLLMVAVMAVVPPVPGREGLGAAVGPSANAKGLGVAALLAAPVLLLGILSDARAMAVAGGAGVLFLFWYRGWLRRHLGGSTGDAVGAAGYVGIVMATLAFAMER
ncbi:adenosylcobinamide-GDP ribazoletransferase [Roseococcus sp. YIM B11640]|uniref:adenosylcobinamide-GDP ribazoletransferase n=1 Tax=Roseococcus sp. YIM B11640 TaxID=3133973 RepID=UPI003C7B7013